MAGVSFYNLPAVNPYLLHNYGGATAAFSLRRLNPDHKEGAIIVRRDSDNNEEEIGFIGEDLDTATLIAFCTGSNGFVTTWYNQASSNNVTQTTAANQPKIYNSATGILTLNSKPAVIFDGVNDSLIGTGINQGLSDYSFFQVLNAQPNTVDWVSFSNGSTKVNEGGFQSFGNSIGRYRPQLHNNTSSSFIGIGISTSLGQTLHSVIGDRLSFNTQYLNGVEGTRSNISSYSAVNLANSGELKIGSGFSFAERYHKGPIQETIFYSSINQAANRTAIETNINNYYNIYP